FAQGAINAWQSKVSEMWAEQVLIPMFRNGGFEFVGSQVEVEVEYLEGGSGTRVIDFLFFKNGRFYGMDLKSMLQSGAGAIRRTWEQLQADNALEAWGGRIVNSGQLQRNFQNLRDLPSVISNELHLVLQ